MSTDRVNELADCCNAEVVSLHEHVFALSYLAVSQVHSEADLEVLIVCTASDYICIGLVDLDCFAGAGRADIERDVGSIQTDSV